MKKAKVTQPAKPVEAAKPAKPAEAAKPAKPVEVEVAVPALTRRNSTPNASTLALGPIVARVRAPQNARVWAAIIAALPATAAALVALPEVKEEAPKVNGAVFVSYALRRGWLIVDQ